MNRRKAWLPGAQPGVCLEQDCSTADGEKWLHPGYISGLTSGLEKKHGRKKEVLNLQIFDRSNWVDDSGAI